MVARPQKHDDDSGDGVFDLDLDPDRSGGVHIVTSAQEAIELFDARARYELGISGAEFFRRWDKGEYGELSEIPDSPEGRRISRVAWLIPTIRLEQIS